MAKEIKEEFKEKESKEKQKEEKLPVVEEKTEKPAAGKKTDKEEKKPKEKPAVDEKKKEEKKEKNILGLAEEKKETSLAKPGKEKVFTIPLRKAFRKSKNRRKNYAISLIKEFLLRHTKTEEVKLGSELNKFVWEKGKPPRRLRVKAVTEGPLVKAELLGFEYKEFKAVPKKEKKGVKDRLLGRLGPKALKKEEEEKMIKEKLKPEKPEKFEKREVAEE